MDDLPLPASVQDSPIARRLQFYVAAVRTGGTQLSEGDVASAWSARNPRFGSTLADLNSLSQRLGAFRLDGYEFPSQDFGVALATDNSGRTWRFQVGIEQKAPHRIVGASVFAAPPGIRVRPAAEGDSPILREIERRTPLVLGDVEMRFDRGEDYFLGERLMGVTAVLVVEKDNVPVGFTASAYPPVRIAGKTYIGSYTHRTRLLPEAQGAGVYGRLNAAQMERGVHQDPSAYASYGFIASANTRVLQRERDARAWPTGPVRLVIPCRDETTSLEPGRPAAQADAGRLIELINRTHEQEELFAPIDPAKLQERLSRVPEVYSWRHVLLNDHACLGVWDARLGVARTADGVTMETVRALVLDYGFDPGHEADLVELVRQAAAELARSGTTELSLFSSPASPGYHALSALALREEPYVVTCFHQPSPAVHENGVYVDQLYF